MMTELILVEGVSDVQLISYYLQKVYGWKYEKNNKLKIVPIDEYEHIESLSKNGNELILCGVGGSGKFAHFIELHRVNEMVVEKDITSLVVVTDRDEASNAKIEKVINDSLDELCVKAGQWIINEVEDSFSELKSTNTYLLIIPTHEKGALERVIIKALEEIEEEKPLIQEVVQFIDYLKDGRVPALEKINNANKATVGTFFSIRNPKNVMRAFATYISKVDWGKSESLGELFSPFAYLGEEKPTI